MYSFIGLDVYGAKNEARRNEQSKRMVLVYPDAPQYTQQTGLRIIEKSGNPGGYVIYFRKQGLSREA